MGRRIPTLTRQPASVLGSDPSFASWFWLWFLLWFWFWFWFWIFFFVLVLVLLLLTLLVLVQVLVVGEMVSSRLAQGRRFYLSPLVSVEMQTTALIYFLAEVGGTIGLLVVWCF